MHQLICTCITLPKEQHIQISHRNLIPRCVLPDAWNISIIPSMYLKPVHTQVTGRNYREITGLFSIIDSVCKHDHFVKARKICTSCSSQNLAKAAASYTSQLTWSVCRGSSWLESWPDWAPDTNQTAGQWIQKLMLKCISNTLNAKK